MDRPHEARNRSGWDITSELFIFEEPQRIRKTLDGLFGVIFLGSVSIAILAWIISWDTAFFLSTTSTALFAAIIFIHRNGRSRVASVLALATITSVSLMGIYLGDGIHDTAIVLLPIIIALGSLVLNRLLFYGMTAVILGAILAIGILEYQGVIINKYSGQWGPGVKVFLVNPCKRLQGHLLP